MTRAAWLVLPALFSVATCGDDATGPGVGKSRATHPTGNTIDTLPLAGRPHGVAVSASGVFYISRVDDDSLTRGLVDSVGESFNSAVAVGDVPAHVALTPDGGTAFSANQYGNSVSVVDVATNTSIDEIPLSDGGFNLLVSRDGLLLYVTTAAGILHIINTQTRAVTDTVHLGQAANGLARAPQGDRVYVSSIFADSIYLIDPDVHGVMRGYTVGGQPQRIAVHSQGDELYLATEAVGLEVLNLRNGSHTPVPGVAPGAVGLALSPDEKVLYLTNPPAGDLVIVDRARRQVIKAIHGLGRPRNVAFADHGRVAIVTGEDGFVYFVR